MQLELGLQSSRGAVLRVASSAEAAWQGGAAAWFEQAASNAWRAELPALVVVPTRTHAQALRSRLLESGGSALGVHFVTPPYLRELLHTHGGEKRLPAREHLRLLLAVAAEEQLANRDLPQPEQLAATAVRRTPDHLLRLLDQLEAAGWPIEAADLDAFRGTITRFHAHLATCDYQTFADTDRAALRDARNEQPRFSTLLINGFHGAHWAMWPLLQAAVAASKTATVLLQYPRDEAADLDSAWIGSWEEAFGEATPAEAETAAEPTNREVRFLVGMDAQEQAEAITAATIQSLADERCSRLAIVCPTAGALSRLVAASLTRRGIPHYDATGQLLPGIFESAAFSTWLELQRTPRLNALLRFLNALEVDQVLFAEISRERLDKTLRNALSDVAIDDLRVLTAYCGESARELLQSIHFLPDRGTLSEFLSATSAAFAALAWHERWQEIEPRSSWAQSFPPIFSRTLYLRWLGEIASTLRLTRDAVGSHPFSRVQILTPAQAEDQTWSHLILAGLNEGAWPAAGRGDLLPAGQIEAFNQSVRKLNRAATRQGKQGEGHIAVRPGKAIFLGAAQQRQLALAQFSSLLDSATVKLVLTASVVQEATPERISNPSEFFSRVYQEQRGVSVSQATVRALRETTSDWLRDSRFAAPPELTQTPQIEQTAVAYRARRAATPSGEYDFALRKQVREIKPLSVSEIESLLKSPALVWMKQYLGVEGTEDVTYAWNSSVGRWTHDWLASISGHEKGFVRLPEATQIDRAVSTAGERKRAEIVELCRIAGKELPDWWQSGWEGAFCLARALGEILATADGWTWAVTEWTLDAQPIPVRADRTLLIRGRADLFLARTEKQPTALRVPELWIVDYKTGNKKLPAPKKSETPEQQQKRALRLILKGGALQLALYALAARELGAKNVELSLVSPITRRAEPQLNIAEFAECQDAFAELARMQQEGVYGMRGPLRGQFTFTGTYPLATLAVQRDLLEERWEATHEALALEEEPFW